MWPWREEDVQYTHFLSSKRDHLRRRRFGNVDVLFNHSNAVALVLKPMKEIESITSHVIQPGRLQFHDCNGSLLLNDHPCSFQDKLFGSLHVQLDEVDMIAKLSCLIEIIQRN